MDLYRWYSMYIFHLTVYGFDADLLAFIPRPVAGLILLFPITPVYETFRKTQDSTLLQTKPPENVWFTRQTVGNACGTVGLLHAFANGIPASDIGPDSPLSAFYKAVKDMSPGDRGTFLETGRESEMIASLHGECSLQGQTDAPTSDEDVMLHFVCLVPRDGHLYELDGRKSGPVDHGICGGDEVLEKCVGVVKQFMARDPNNVSFTAIALVSAE